MKDNIMLANKLHLVISFQAPWYLSEHWTLLWLKCPRLCSGVEDDSAQFLHKYKHCAYRFRHCDTSVKSADIIKWNQGGHFFSSALKYLRLRILDYGTFKVSRTHCFLSLSASLPRAPSTFPKLLSVLQLLWHNHILVMNAMHCCLNTTSALCMGSSPFAHYSQ